MEFFQNAKAVKLRSHLDKYLVADDDRHTVRQSRNGSSRKARWLVELIEDGQLIRLKSCHGKYLTASNTPFLLGMTGERVTQTVHSSNSNPKSDPSIEWEPKRDGFQVKLVTKGGKYLRANGGTPPWRNSITHDNPHAGGTKSWVLWDVEVVDIPESEDEDVMDYLSKMSSFSSVLSDDVYSLEPESPMSVMSSLSPRFSSRQTGMDLFHNAKAVRLRGHHDKYLIAEEDEESITQDRNGSTKAARWTVEFSTDSTNIIRLKSCYNKYLTASNQPFLLGMTGRKVLQTQPRRVDSSVEWEPIREGTQVKLKTRYGQFLRANGGLPPWRNSVTHDIPHRTATQDWILWNVDVVEIQVLHSPVAKSPGEAAAHSDSFASGVSSPPYSVSINSATFSRHESSDSPVRSPPKVEGRTIYYHVAEEDGEVDDSTVGFALTFKGNGVDELTKKLEEETGLENITVCSRSPLNQKLYPLRLQLPPNNGNMRVVVVPSSSKVARDFA